MWEGAKRWVLAIRGRHGVDVNTCRWADMALQSMTHLQCYPHTGIIRSSTRAGLTGRALVRHLVDFLSNEPLSMDHMDDMLNVIEGRIREREDLVNRVQVASVEIWLELRAGARCGWTRYGIGQNLGELRSLAAQMASRETRLASVWLPWLSDGSWVVYVLEVPRKVIRTPAWEISRETFTDVKTIQEWLRVANLGEWAVESTVSCGGPEDGISCGIIAVNAIAHDLFQDELWTETTREMMRMEAYVNALRRGDLRDNGGCL